MKNPLSLALLATFFVIAAPAQAAEDCKVTERGHQAICSDGPRAVDPDQKAIYRCQAHYSFKSGLRQIFSGVEPPQLVGEFKLQIENRQYQSMLKLSPMWDQPAKNALYASIRDLSVQLCKKAAVEKGVAYKDIRCTGSCGSIQF